MKHHNSPQADRIIAKMVLPISKQNNENHALLLFSVEASQLKQTFTRTITRLLRLPKKYQPSPEELDDLEVLGDFVSRIED